MNLSKILLLLYCFFSAISIFAIVLDNDNLFMIGKITLFPCLMFYYFDQIKKINYLFLFFFMLFFIADVIIVLGLTDTIQYLDVIFNVNHLIILFFTFQNIEKRKIDDKILIFTIFMFLLCFSIQYLVFDLVEPKNPKIAISILFSGIIVSIFNSISLYNYLKRNCYINYYFGFACLSLGLMYICFNIYQYIYNVKILRILSLTFKISAYFLFIKFIIAKEIYLLKKSSNL